MTPYSQFGQDAAVIELFPAGHKGVYVDVGAADGMYLSNTLALEQVGWTGLCVEADPAEFDKLTITRPHALRVNMACANHRGSAAFQRVPVEGWSGLSDYPHQLNAAAIAQMEREGELEKFDVPCAPLQAMLDPMGLSAIDYLSIDVEGAELSVLESVDWGRTTIRVITVEINRTDGAIGRYLLERGYCLWAVLGSDEMYVLKDWLMGGRL
jgi:FkbM family methyltransferase